MMRAIIGRLIAPILTAANADPGVLYRSQFYELKQRLLQRYGRKVGEDVQRIVDRCWGHQDENGCQGSGCRRCGGTGIWMERWILLERWELAGRVFHRPIGPTKPRAIDYIDGYIRHKASLASLEARLWLLLLFDRRTFLRSLGSSKRYGFTWYPLVLLQKLGFHARQAYSQLTPRSCSCGRRFFPLFERGFWCVCRHCSPRPWLWGRYVRPGVVIGSTGNDDLPF